MEAPIVVVYGVFTTCDTMAGIGLAWLEYRLLRKVEGFPDAERYMVWVH